MSPCWSAVRSVLGVGVFKEEMLVADLNDVNSVDVDEAEELSTEEMLTFSRDLRKRTRRQHELEVDRTEREALREGRRRGKPKGARNRDKQDLLDLIEATGCSHPIQGLAEVAVIARKNDNLDLATTCYKELAQYVAPKRKAIEVSTEVEDNSPLVIVLPDSHAKDITPPTQSDDEV